MKNISTRQVIEKYAPYFFIMIILISSMRMFPELWDKNFHSVYGNPFLSGDYPVWTVYAQKNSSIKILDFWPFEVPVLTFFAGKGLGSTYSTPLILPFLLTKLVNASLSVKICYLLTLVLTFHSFFLMCSKYSKRSIAAFTAFICVQLVANNDQIKAGMWYNFMSINFSAYFIYCWDNYLAKEVSKKLNFLLSILCWTLSIYTHPIGNITCGLYWFASLTLYRNKISDHIFILGIVCLLGFPQLIQQIRNPHSDGTTLVNSNRLTSSPITSCTISFKKILFPLKIWCNKNLNWMRFYEPTLSWTNRLKYIFLPFLLFGVLSHIKYYKEKSKFIILLFGLYLYLFATGILQSIFNNFSFMESLLIFKKRLTLTFYTPFAIFFSSGLQILFSAKQQNKLFYKSLTVKVSRLIITTIFILSFAEIILTKHGTIMTESDLSNEENHKSMRMVEFLNDPNNGIKTDQYRICIENNYYIGDKLRSIFAYPHAHIAALGGLHSNAQLIGAAWRDHSPFSQNYISSVHLGLKLLGLKLKELSADKIIEKSRRLNIRYFLIKDKQIISSFKKMDVMNFNCDLGAYNLFELKSHKNGWAYGKTNYEVMPHTEWDKHSAMFNIPFTFNDSTIIISRAYSRNFKAYLNGLPLKISSWEQLIEVHLPSGNHGGKQLSLKLKYFE